MELGNGCHYGRGRPQLSEPNEDSGTDLQFGDLAVKVTRYDAFTEQLEATHLGLDKAASVIAAPLISDFSTQQARGRQDGVAGYGARTMVLPWLGVLVSGDNRLRPKLRNRFVTAFGVVGTITVDAGDDLVGGNLVQQARPHRRITGSVVGYFDSPDFQCGRINCEVDLAPLATVVGPMLFGLTPAFTEHLDASAVDKEVQSRCCRLRADRHEKMLLAPAYGTEVGQLPVQASKLEQALRHTHRLAQGQAK